MSNLILLDLTERIKAAIMENASDIDGILSTVNGMGSGGMAGKAQLFEASGVWTRPHSNVGLVWALIVAAGGAGYGGTSSSYGGQGGGGGEVVYTPIIVTGDLTITVGIGNAAAAGGNSQVAGLMTWYAVGGGKALANNGSSDSYGAGGSITTLGGAPSTVYGPHRSRSGGGSGGKNGATPVAPGGCVGYADALAASTTAADGSPGGGSFNQGGALQSVDGVGNTPSGYGGGSSGSKNTATTAAGANGMVLLSWFE